MKTPASERHWDDLFRTTWFQLREGETLRTAWFDDARSLREKLKLVQLYHLRGYAAWRLGVEDPEFWQPEGACVRAVTATPSNWNRQNCYTRYLSRNLFPGEKPCEPARLLVYRF